ncbi:hypothetical protein [Bacillus albus]|uniref:hypothetical protein n=1 Tax=Bacillus albus TaxID=2026189 RepID=UPI00257104EF|nr:hypothetical protein [Bacillus albus]
MSVFYHFNQEGSFLKVRKEKKEKFNQYTIDYNKEKLSFYKGAKIEIKEQKPEK